MLSERFISHLVLLGSKTSKPEDKRSALIKLYRKKYSVNRKTEVKPAMINRILPK